MHLNLEHLTRLVPNNNNFMKNIKGSIPWIINSHLSFVKR